MNNRRCMTHGDIRYVPSINHKQTESQNQNGNLVKSFFSNKTINQNADFLRDQFNTNITIINKQLSNIEVDKRQILYIPTYINQKILKKNHSKEYSPLFHQQVSSFVYLPTITARTNSKDLTKENQDLKDHIKFLLGQIKKIQKTNSNASKDKLNETKMISDNIIELKAQIEDNKAVINKLKLDYNQIAIENDRLKNILSKKTSSSSFDNLKPVRDVQAYIIYSNDQLEMNSICEIPEEGEVIDDFNDVSLALSDNVIPNSNEIFLMRLIKEDSTVLCFNKIKRTFSFTEYFDKGHIFTPYFEEEKAIYLTKNNHLYVVISNRAYLYNHSSHSISQLPNLKKLHNKGSLFLYENRLLCLSGMENESVEEFIEDDNTWALLPSLSSPRAEASYLVLNTSTLFCFFGYNYKYKEYLSSIEYIDLMNDAKTWNYYSNKSITIRKHSVFASSKGILYLLGGKTDDSYNSTSLQLTYLPSERKGFEIVKIQDDLPKYIYESNFYEYVDIGSGDITKIAFDEENNIHLVNTETLHHTIITYI